MHEDPDGPVLSSETAEGETPKPAPPPEGKRVKRSDLLNLLNLVNFREGTVFVCFKHKEKGTTLYCQAHPLPCEDETLTCRWIESDLQVKRLAEYDLDRLVLSDGHSQIVVKAELVSLGAREVVFRLPISGYEIGVRAMDRHACDGISASILQYGIRLEGRLDDFSAVSFRVLADDAAALHWINTQTPVTLSLSKDGKLAYSGECLVTRLERGPGAVVLAPNFTNIRRYRPLRFRSKRQSLLPAPQVRFGHPLVDRPVHLKVENISTAGICVEEFLDRSFLLPGMIVPELSIEIANSFVLKCPGQVLYRNVIRAQDDSFIVRCGIVFLDMRPDDQVKLSAIVHQTLDEKLRVCSSVDMDELWRFFFESGFIYPSKYLSLQARKEEFKRTYRTLYLDNPSIARHFLFQDKGQIFGHMSMLRFYSDTWMIHHHAASRSGYGLAGVSVLDEMGRFTNDIHHHPSAHMMRLMCYYRRENRFPSRVFGNVAKDINDKKGSSLDAFAYLYLPEDDGASSESFQLFPARDEDLRELSRSYEAGSGGLMLEALDLGSASESDPGLSAEYARLGLKRDRQVFCLKGGGRVLAILLLTISDSGLNLSNLTNCIHALVIEPERLEPKTLFSALHLLRSHYGADEPPILVYPEDYLERNSIPYEKKYVLWVLDQKFSDAYFDSVRNTFKRSSRDEEN